MEWFAHPLVPALPASGSRVVAHVGGVLDLTRLDGDQLECALECGARVYLGGDLVIENHLRHDGLVVRVDEREHGVIPEDVVPEVQVLLLPHVLEHRHKASSRAEVFPFMQRRQWSGIERRFVAQEGPAYFTSPARDVAAGQIGRISALG